MSVKIDEAEVDLVARQLPTVIQAQNDLVAQQLYVNLSQALFQGLVQLYNVSSNH